jgi:hypothetical protein
MTNRKPPKETPPVLNPERGDAILRHMLKTKPKPHKDMVKGEKAKKPKDPRK